MFKCPSLVPCQMELAEHLSKNVMPGHLTRYLFTNSGAEAVDNAIKIARAMTGKQNIIAFDVRTLASAQAPHLGGWGPLQPTQPAVIA